MGLQRVGHDSATEYIGSLHLDGWDKLIDIIQRLIIYVNLEYAIQIQ